MSLHRACCCCSCPGYYTLEVRGNVPLTQPCPSNVPTSPPFAAVGPFFDCTGDMKDQSLTVYVQSQGTGSNLPCYFSELTEWCGPSGGTPAWPIMDNWPNNITRTLCTGFSNPGGLALCGTKFGAAPTALQGLSDGFIPVTYQSAYDSVNSRHQITVSVGIPTYYDTSGWVGGSVVIRAYKASSARDCFPRGQWTLYNTTNDNTHGWVRIYISSFNNTTGAIVRTTVRETVAAAPFEVWTS